ncbi:MAG: hypothetical protein HGA39_00190 [Coriobacteriia bacterium]|nr:hypothetical protein [Coriobacteriia bacterium]
MADNLFKRFIAVLGTVPEPRAPIIPKGLRIPFFLGLIALSLLLLALIVLLVVVPEISAMKSTGTMRLDVFWHAVA